MFFAVVFWISSPHQWLEIPWFLGLFFFGLFSGRWSFLPIKDRVKLCIATEDTVFWDPKDVAEGSGEIPGNLGWWNIFSIWPEKSNRANLPLGGGNSNISYFHPVPLQKWSNLTCAYFWNGLIQPPVSTLQGMNISHQTGKGKSSTQNCHFWADMLVSWRVTLKEMTKLQSCQIIRPFISIHSTRRSHSYQSIGIPFGPAKIQPCPTFFQVQDASSSNSGTPWPWPFPPSWNWVRRWCLGGANGVEV